jgi:transposase
MRLAARPIQKRLQANITWLERELNTTDLSTTIHESPVWREKEEVLRSVPGVRPVLTRTLFGNLPELGTLTRTEVAAVAGIACSRATAGHPKGEAPPGEAAFYQGLCHAGKAKTLAVTACMRKLLTISMRC